MNDNRSENRPGGRENKKERLLTRDYAVVMLSSGCMNFFNNAAIAAMPLYMMLLTGKAFFSGLIMSVYSMTALAVRPVSGILCDRFGRVKLLAAGAFLCALTCLGMGFTPMVALIILFRMAGGIGFGFQSTCAGAVAADVVPKSRLAEGIGYYSLNSTLGQFVAPAVALAVVAGGAVADYRVLFLISAAVTCASGIFGCFITYERKQKNRAEAPEEKRDPRDNAGQTAQDGSARKQPGTFLGFERGVLAPALVMILLYFGFSTAFSFLTVFADLRGFGNIGLYYTVSATGVLAARLTVGKTVDKHGSDVVVIPMLAVLVVCMAVVPFTRSMAQLAALGVPMGLAQGAILPAMNSMMFRRCSPNGRGSASSAFYASIDFGFAVSIPILGLIADATDIRFVFWVSSVWIAVSLLCYILICTDKRYNSKQSYSGSR